MAQSTHHPPKKPDMTGQDRSARARQFMADARSIQLSCGKVVRGMSYRTEQIRDQANGAQEAGEALGALPELSGERMPRKRRRILYDRFVELCRRRQITIPPELAPWVYRHLAEELAENTHRLRLRPATLTSATLHVGRLSPVIDAYPEFHDTPYVFRTAVRNQPVNPGKFLERVRETIAALQSDPRAQAVRDNPRLLRRIAVLHPTDPVGSLLTGCDPALRARSTSRRGT